MKEHTKKTEDSLEYVGAAKTDGPNGALTPLMTTLFTVKW